MSYRVLTTNIFAKEFKLLSRKAQDAIRKKIVHLREDPTRYKRLHYALKDSFRVRVDKLMVLFSYDERKKEIYLEKIVPRHRY